MWKRYQCQSCGKVIETEEPPKLCRNCWVQGKMVEGEFKLSPRGE